MLKILQNRFTNLYGGVYNEKTGENGFYDFIRYDNWLQDVSKYIDTGHLANFAQYEPGETRIENIYGEKYTFYGFLKSGSEITSVLGYSSEDEKLKLGDSCSSYEDLKNYLYLKNLENQYKHSTLDNLDKFIATKNQGKSNPTTDDLDR